MAIILPNFYDNFVQNNILIDGFMLEDRVNILGVSGSFAHSYYKHDVNYNMYKDFVSYTEMLHCLEEYSKMECILLDFSNPYLEYKDYHSRLAKIHFNNFAGIDNVYFIVSQIEFINYIVENYPLAKFIVDLDYCNGDFSSYSQIMGVISNNKNKLADYNYKYKILRVAVYNCHNCRYFEKCLELDTKAAMEFSSVSNFYNCTKKEFKPL
jgi:hypothetical protein